MDVLAGWDANPDRLELGAFTHVRVVAPWIVVFRTIGMWATLFGFEFVAVVLVVFERKGTRLPLGSFLLGFGVHDYLFSDRLICPSTKIIR